MNPDDPNVRLVEEVAQGLGELCDELVFVGGCAASLLCTSPQAPPLRVTYDVDVIAEVVALSGYHALERQFTAHGFVRDMSPDAPICRWRFGRIEVDLMPSDENILGFSNRWYGMAIETASEVILPGGERIRLVSAPAFLATKFEAFSTRGGGDPMVSHDFEDIINVLDGRPGIEDEIAVAPAELTEYLTTRFAEVSRHPTFENTLPGLIAYDELYDSRLETVRRRIAAIAAMELK